MNSKDDIFVNCDDLDKIPKLNRDNYIFEHNFIVKSLPKEAKILQVGSMDGMRAVRLLKARPDIKFAGLELEESLVDMARRNISSENLNAEFIVGDITDPPGDIPDFDYVICLNNTLGFIPDYKKAIEVMREIGENAIISVYGEKFNDDLAKEYFNSIGLEVESIENDGIRLKDFSVARRFNNGEIRSWGGKVTDSPLGYICELN